MENQKKDVVLKSLMLMEKSITQNRIDKYKLEF